MRSGTYPSALKLGSSAYASAIDLTKPLLTSYYSQVIVGTNGSGKSTLLKLLTRVYDVTEGKILVDGKDIRSLKLHDLHRAMSVLFQDYTHFQLSVSQGAYNVSRVLWC